MYVYMASTELFRDHELISSENSGNILSLLLIFINLNLFLRTVLMKCLKDLFRRLLFYESLNLGSIFHLNKIINLLSNTMLLTFLNHWQLKKIDYLFNAIVNPFHGVKFDLNWSLMLQISSWILFLGATCMFFFSFCKNKPLTEWIKMKSCLL